MLAGVVVGGQGCAAPHRPAATRPVATRPAIASPPPAATIHFEKLPALPALPAPTELVDRNVPSDALKHYLAGAALADEYRDADAILEFEAAIAADPAGFEPRLGMGRSALRAGDLTRAHAALEAAVKQRPRLSEVHYLLGLVAAGREDGQGSLRQLRYALALATDDGERIRVYYHLAQVLERLDYLQAAIEIATRFETLARQDVSKLPLQPQWRDLVTSQGWRIPALRGACLRRLGKPHEAVAAYDASLAMSPDNSEILLSLAETLIDAGNTRRAAQIADQVLSKEPTNVSALAMLAATMVVDERQEELRQRLLTLVRENPSDLLLAQRVAAIFLKFNQLDAALQALLITRKSISEPGPVYAAVLQIVLANDQLQPAVDGLGGMLAQMEPAERDLLLEPIDSLQVSRKLVQDIAVQGEAVLSRAGRDGTKLLALGVIAGVAHQPVLAEKALRAALQAQPDSLLIAVSLGEQLLAQCRWKDAIALAEPLVGKFADSGALQRILGEAYDGLDDYKSAMTNLYEALRKDRKDVQAMWLAAQINDRLGQMQPASSIYQVLVTIKPDAWEAQVALVKDLLAQRQKDAALQHVKRLKEAFPASAAVDLCALMVQANDAVPPSGKIGALLKRYPDDATLRQALAEAYLSEGNPDRASRMLMDLLANDPTSEDARLLLTTSLARQLQIDLATQVLESLLAEHPNRILWRFAYAELLAQAGRPEAAADVLLDLLKTPWGQEQKHTVLSRLVFFLEYAGQHERARDLLQQELKASPNDRALQAQLLGVLENQDRRAEAIELLRTWRKGAEDDSLLRRLQGQFLRALDAEDAAVAETLSDWPAGKGPSGKDLPAKEAGRLAAHDQDLALLAAAMPSAETADWLVSRAWMGPAELTAASLAEEAAQHGRYAEAVELDRLAGHGDESLARQTQWTFLAGDRARAELVLMPRVQSNSEMYERLDRLRSTFYKRMGLNDLAVRQTEAIYERYKDTEKATEAANDLAYVYAESGLNLALADQLGKRAVAGDASSAAYMDTLAWVYYQEGRFSEALRWISQAVRVPGQGDDPVLRDHLGDVYWRMGQRGKAAEAWRRASALYVEQLKTDQVRPDLRQGLEGVTEKIKAIESHKPPPVAPWAGQKKRRPS